MRRPRDPRPAPVERKHPREELQLRLDGAALPSRVQRAAQMFAEAIEAAGGESAGLTMVVSNFDMKVALRGWDHRSASQVEEIARVVSNPLEAVQASPRARGIARAIANGSRELASIGGIWRRPGQRSPLMRLDDAFVSVMEAAAHVTPPVPRTVAGTSEIYTTVLRAGRKNEGGATQARVLVAGNFRDVEVESRVVAAFHDAAKSGELYRVRIRATWVEAPDGAMLIAPSTVVATQIAPWKPIGGFEAVRELASLVTPDDIAAMLEGMRGDS